MLKTGILHLCTLKIICGYIQVQVLCIYLFVIFKLPIHPVGDLFFTFLLFSTGAPPRNDCSLEAVTDLIFGEFLGPHTYCTYLAWISWSIYPLNSENQSVLPRVASCEMMLLQPGMKHKPCN